MLNIHVYLRINLDSILASAALVFHCVTYQPLQFFECANLAILFHLIMQQWFSSVLDTAADESKSLWHCDIASQLCIYRTN